MVNNSKIPSITSLLQRWLNKILIETSIKPLIFPLYVAVGNNFGTPNTTTAALSNDGINFTAGCPIQPIAFQKICTGYDQNGVEWFVGCTNNSGIAGIATSYDGFTWFNQTFPPIGSGNSLWDIAYGNGIFVICGSGNAPTLPILSSPDGRNWTLRSTTASGICQEIIFANNQFVGVGNNFFITSPDGINFTKISSSLGITATVCYGNGIYVTVDNSGNVSYSTDLVHWTTNNISGLTAQHINVQFANGVFIISVGGSRTGIIYTSSNAINWIARSGIIRGFTAKASVWTGSLFVGTNALGTITSSDLITFTAHTISGFNIIGNGGLACKIQ